MRPPKRRQYVVEEYVKAKEDRESIWDGVYRVIGDTEKYRVDVLFKENLGQTCSPDESAIFLANTYFPKVHVDIDNPYRTELRRCTDENDFAPEALDILAVANPSFTEAEIILMVSLDIVEAFENMVAGHKEPAACPQMSGKPLRYRDGLLARSESCGSLSEAEL
ncbi:hypothetical protein EVAR_2970_1 [Eumeta japonica]|uniref:Uncharacterized protein n=1 Tax=Eumeta variegata TaxID=151549 RepID=A0A4C1SW77_EUMVA|nr:hypothetical protein EVAR_2970_1 [Eumeta japonica]